MSAELKITDRSFDFAVRVVKLCRFLESHDRVSKTLANQLLRSGTSIGANVEEAQAGQSKADFIAQNVHCSERGAGNHISGCAFSKNLKSFQTLSSQKSSKKLTKSSVSSLLSSKPLKRVPQAERMLKDKL